MNAECLARHGVEEAWLWNGSRSRERRHGRRLAVKQLLFGDTSHNRFALGDALLPPARLHRAISLPGSGTVSTLSMYFHANCLR